MKKTNKLLKRTVVVISLEIAGAIFLSVLITLFVIIPNFNSWQQNINLSTELNGRLKKISNNVESVRKLNGIEMDNLNKKLDLVLPSEGDSLRFLSLVGKVAKISGMKFDSASAVIGKTSVAPTTPTTQPGETPSLSTGGGTTTQGTGISSGSQGRLSVKLSFTGSFPAFLSLLANFEKVDRIALITSVSISKSTGDEGTSVALNFDLPLSTKIGEVSAENLSLLTDQDRESLREILDKMVVTAAPAKSKTGRSDPFK